MNHNGSKLLLLVSDFSRPSSLNVAGTVHCIGLLDRNPWSYTLYALCHGIFSLKESPLLTLSEQILCFKRSLARPCRKANNITTSKRLDIKTTSIENVIEISKRLHTRDTRTLILRDILALANGSFNMKSFFSGIRAKEMTFFGFLPIQAAESPCWPDR